jgi:hypothetical protein
VISAREEDGAPLAAQPISGRGLLERDAELTAPWCAVHQRDRRAS